MAPTAAMKCGFSVEICLLAQELLCSILNHPKNPSNVIGCQVATMSQSQWEGLVFPYCSDVFI